MESIVQAKDRQAAEANKNASILLEELDLEKVMITFTYEKYLLFSLLLSSPYFVICCFLFLFCFVFTFALNYRNFLSNFVSNTGKNFEYFKY